MEIEFQLENSDLVFAFEPEWNRRNRSSREVQWRFPNGSHTRTLANLLHDLPVQTTTVKPNDSLDDM
tara:strand:+ start:97 stop:297 length:201 start_codon:yes stop_codon:yes gene_type:complete